MMKMWTIPGKKIVSLSLCAQGRCCVDAFEGYTYLYIYYIYHSKLVGRYKFCVCVKIV